jgi:hypothetical protein
VGHSDLICLDFLKTNWLASDLQQMPTWSKLSPPGFCHLTDNVFYVGIHVFVPWGEKCLNVGGDCGSIMYTVCTVQLV